MAPTHVPGEQLPPQGQNLYTNSPYPNIYSVDQYDAQSWNGQLQHAALVPDNSQAQTQTWHHNTYPAQPYSQINSPYGNQGLTNRTASPYQYGQFGSHNAPASYGHAANVDPSLSVNPNVMRQQPQSPYQPQPQGRPNIVTPQSLQHGQDPRAATSYQVPKSTAETFVQRPVQTPFVQPIAVPDYEIPKAKTSGSFYVFDQAALIKATKSIALNKFVTLGTEPFHLPTNRTALPIYTPRQSVKDLKKVGAHSKKLAKKAPTKQLSAGRVLKREFSESDSYDDSSDDDSDYSDEEDEPSPLPATKPEEPQGAFRYDIIKVSWYPHRSPPSTEKIKTSVRQLWEIFNTIQNRWRSDSKLLKEAEDQKKTGELPVLKRRVAEQRDLLQSALRSSLEFSHPDVVSYLGQVKPFLYLCYLFLANRVKVLDYDGELTAAILEMLSRCSGTTTTEVLEETKLSKALNVLKKKVNDNHKTLIQKIEDGAAAGSKKAKVGSPPEVDVTAEAKPAKRPALQPAGRPSSEGPSKKLKPTEPTTNGDKKPSTATGASKVVPATQQKRPGDKPIPAPVRTQGIKITNKPSSLFASLNAAGKKPSGAAASTSAAKPVVKSTVSVLAAKKPAASATKPTFSFKDTMAELLKPKEEKSAAPSKTEKQLPPETPEEKAKRLRKESRRHLRVKFRPGDALVSIKYFHHDPEEETGHDENFVRDAGDIGGEGRMFKQHKEMDDEDDEEEKEIDYLPWKEPSPVDFSVVSEGERKRNYAPYGGGELQPTCPERDANIAHDNATLEIFYSRPADIPTSPREPLLEQMQPSDTPVVTFGSPPDYVLSRLPESTTYAPTALSVPPIDMNNITNIVQQLAGQSNSNQANYLPAPAPAPATPVALAAPTATPDISSILSLLGQGQSQNPIQAPMVAPPAQPAALPPMDMAQILAMAQQLTQQGGAAFPPPPPNWPGFPPMPQQQQPDMASMYSAQGSQQPSQHGNSSGKRQRSDDGSEAHGRDKRGKHEKGPYKVIPCKFFEMGKCNKGAKCTFIHPQQ
ncbi:uncharacterized protein CC84DRAFT_1080335 [Paraphaeosphaeria sporulosa]|uniref:C3H1-type domain-containing protein n=1 Tax=Paraphaeosphaeria sporulosa TaxID=1460663 RepID=A0A177CX24_9PLEO|nr:uncharacterized protein CC84DRAFT_1080335 [Paraphaeosphaeria sporulosa]OAG12073.1 hypothetical protein CC84DRAFT_1080335 [Paraphaeosphaeria sporulosa]